MASPRVEGIVGRIFRTTVADNVLGTGSEADVRVGKIFPILALQSGPDPLHIGFGVQVSGRFSLHDPQNTFISNDWWVGFNLTKKWSAWDGTIQLYHESSHLDDEYAELSGVSRQGWTREVAEGWLGYHTGSLRFSGTLAYVLQGIPNLPGVSGGAGVDWLGPTFWALGGPVQLVAGVFVESASQTSGQLSTMGREHPGLGHLHHRLRRRIYPTPILPIT